MINNKKQVSSFWSIFFAIVALCAIALAVYYFVTLSDEIARLDATTITDDNYYKLSLDNSISDNMYSTIDSLTAIDTELAKLSVTQDRDMQHQLLRQLPTNASNLATSVGHLPLNDSDNKYTIEQYINGLYSCADNLCDYVAEGATLTQEHVALLAELRLVTQYLHGQFNGMVLEGDGLTVTDSLRSDGSNSIDSFVLDMDTAVVEEGCDAIDRFAHCPTTDIVMGEDITTQQAKDMVMQLLQEHHGIAVDAVSVQNAEGNSSPFYYISAIADNSSAYVIVTKDGRVAQLDTSSVFVGQPIDDSATVAQDYANMLGYEVTAVGMPRIEGNIHYVTLCPMLEGVSIYPDTVKVAVDASSGAVIAFDAMQYITHHTDRQLQWGSVTAESAQEGIAEGAVVHGVSRALIECDGQEICCHELAVGMGEDMYLLHVDSNTGTHVNMRHLTSRSAVIDR